MIFRDAKMEDVPSIQRLINGYASSGLMLAKPLISIYENLREYVVAEEDGKVIGVGGLHILWQDLAEVRSVAVDSNYIGKGVGRQILQKLEEEARYLGLPKIFALTLQTEFFLKQGFQKIEHNSLPQKVWMECINCPKFPDCDEQAVLKTLV